MNIPDPYREWEFKLYRRSRLYRYVSGVIYRRYERWQFRNRGRILRNPIKIIDEWNRTFFANFFQAAMDRRSFVSVSDAPYSDQRRREVILQDRAIYCAVPSRKQRKLFTYGWGDSSGKNRVELFYSKKRKLPGS